MDTDVTVALNVSQAPDDDEITLDLGLERQFLLDLPEDCGITASRLQGLGKRSNQEDAFAVSPCTKEDWEKRGVLFILCDGMGGMQDGEVASAAGIASCLSFFSQVSRGGFYPGWMKDMAERANTDTIHAMGDAAGSGGSTLVAVHIFKNRLQWVTIGDSHLYEAKDGALTQLNEDHIFARKLDKLAENGVITQEEANSNHQRKALTSYLGVEEGLEIDGNEEARELVSGEWICLMSDGIFGTLSDEEILQALSMAPAKAALEMDRMVAEKAKPKQDNYTGILIQVK